MSNKTLKSLIICFYQLTKTCKQIKFNFHNHRSSRLMNIAWWFFLMGFFIVGWGISITLQPFELVPHLRLCNIQKECEDIVLVIDSGSTDLWLSDISCKTCSRMSVKCLPQKIVRNSFESSPGKWVPLKQKQIQYGVGWVKGYEVDYKLCGIDTKILCVTSSRDIESFASHGVLGIGGNLTGNQFLKHIIRKLNMSQSISLFFGSYFSELTIGGLNYDYLIQSNLSNEEQYYESTADWTLEVTNLKMGGAELKSRIVALVDSGSSVIVVPEYIFNRSFYELLKVIKNPCSIQTYGIVCLCYDSSEIQKFPLIEIQFKNKNITKKYKITNDLYVSWNKGYCTASITSLKKYEGILILGSPFLKQHITHFDLNVYRLGLFEANISDIKRNQRINMSVIVVLIIMIVGVVSRLLIIANTKREAAMCNI